MKKQIAIVVLLLGFMFVSVASAQTTTKNLDNFNDTSHISEESIDIDLSGIGDLIGINESDYNLDGIAANYVRVTNGTSSGLDVNLSADVIGEAIDINVTNTNGENVTFYVDVPSVSGLEEDLNGTALDQYSDDLKISNIKMTVDGEDRKFKLVDQNGDRYAAVKLTEKDGTMDVRLSLDHQIGPENDIEIDLPDVAEAVGINRSKINISDSFVDRLNTGSENNETSREMALRIAREFVKGLFVAADNSSDVNDTVNITYRGNSTNSLAFNITNEKNISTHVFIEKDKILERLTGATESLDNVNLLVDDETTIYTVKTSDGTEYVGFTIDHFSTRTVELRATSGGSQTTLFGYQLPSLRLIGLGLFLVLLLVTYIFFRNTNSNEATVKWD